jgi:CRP-like cAMP-binding protein
MKDVWHLHNVNWLSELTPEELGRLGNGSRPQRYQTGAIVFEPTPEPHSVYLLESGRIRIYRISETGLETSFGYVSPGEIFGELSALGDYPRESFARAVADSLVQKFERLAFQALLSQRPEIAIAITKQVGERLKRIESRVENLVFRDVRTRVTLILLELAKDIGRQVGEQLVLDAPLTQAELATLVGSTRQSVNACLRELTLDGLIGRAGRHLAILKPSELRESIRSAPAH